MSSQKDKELQDLESAQEVEGLKRKRLLILASGPVSPNLTGDLGPIMASNIPLSNSLSLFLLLEKAYDTYQDIYVTLDYSKKEIGKLLAYKFPEIQIQYSACDSTFSQILMEFLNQNEKFIDAIDIVFGDTLKTSLFDLEDVFDAILVAENTDSTNWDKIIRNQAGGLEILWKGSHYGGKGTITGGFRIQNVPLLRELLNQNIKNKIIASPRKIEGNAFYESLLEYDELQNREVLLIEDKDWADLGHLDTYFSQRRRLMSSGFRVFNSVVFDLENDSVIKTGNTEKIQNELSWFAKLPQEMLPYVPRFTNGPTANTYITQYIQNLPLSDSWVSENTDDSFWLGFIESLTKFSSKCKTYSDSTTIEAQEKYKYSMYVTKVMSRFEDLIKNLGSEIHLSSDFRINGKFVPPIKKTLNSILEVGDDVSKMRGWNLIHGDLCFSNILFEPRAKKILLIDPRGSFGKSGIYGDPLYELLKISQCAMGDYDYLSTNLYSLKFSSQDLELFIPNPESHTALKLMFETYLQNELIEFGISMDKFRILEAGLFLSAASLHPENDRDLAMLAKACLIVEQYS